MAISLRSEFAGALYQVTARGDGRENTYLADGDRRLFLDLVDGGCGRFNWVVHAYCLMRADMIRTPRAWPWSSYRDRRVFRKRRLYALQDNCDFFGLHYSCASKIVAVAEQVIGKAKGKTRTLSSNS